MHAFRRSVIALTAVAACLFIVGVAQAQIPRLPHPLEPTGATGEAIWPAYESWSRNADGTLTLSLGYFNRNDEVVEIPIGADNNMGPGDPDKGQPTHFLPGRHIGVFSITVTEAEAERKVTWAIRVNNQLSEIAFWQNPEYFADPYLDAANGNTPPLLTLGPDGDDLTGPTPDVAASYTATVGRPLTLLASAADKALGGESRAADGDDDDAPRRRQRRPPLSVTWKKYRGPGEVTFVADGIDAAAELTHSFDDLAGGETSTAVTFSEPGQYRLMVIGNDSTIAAGEGSTRQCCWTTAQVDVTVGP
ncbi:MAG TPA: hypothetical protein EYQ83_06265 [Acidobacteria bacterium]|nr:hypothetical protein [Acidobacteriota bacterium]